MSEVRRCPHCGHNRFNMLERRLSTLDRIGRPLTDDMFQIECTYCFAVGPVAETPALALEWGCAPRFQRFGRMLLDLSTVGVLLAAAQGMNAFRIALGRVTHDHSELAQALVEAHKETGRLDGSFGNIND